MDPASTQLAAVTPSGRHRSAALEASGAPVASWPKGSGAPKRAVSQKAIALVAFLAVAAIAAVAFFSLRHTEPRTAVQTTPEPGEPPAARGLRVVGSAPGGPRSRPDRVLSGTPMQPGWTAARAQRPRKLTVAEKGFLFDLGVHRG
jgi:hypothetical protein